MGLPKCGKMMKNGKLCARGGNGLYWLLNEEEVGFIVANNIINKNKGIVLVNTNQFRGISHTAYVCEECRKIIMDY